MIKRKPTPEEIEAREQEKIFNRRFSGFKRTLKTQCHEEGLRKVELQLEFLRQHPNTLLPRENLNYEQTVQCFEDAIKEYKDALRIKPAA